MKNNPEIVRNYKNKDWLFHEYYTKEKTIGEIAKECNLPQCCTIAYWLKKHNIERRTSYESWILNNTGKCNITTELEEFINGELLGDGSMCVQGSKTAYYQHGSKYIDYINFLINIFKIYNIGYIGNIRKNYKGEGLNGSLYTYSFSTKSYPELRSFYDKFYKDSIKIVPSDIDLTPITVRQWFIGDGSLIKRKRKERYKVKLCTHSFSRNEVYFLAFLLENRLKVKCKVKQQKLSNPNIGFYIVVNYDYLANFYNYIGDCPMEVEHIYGYKWDWVYQ